MTKLNALGNYRTKAQPPQNTVNKISKSCANLCLSSFNCTVVNNCSGKFCVGPRGHKFVSLQGRDSPTVKLCFLILNCQFSNEKIC